jgi:Yippee zinc-binding/DNA-binding /Mis18, centromere assembly
MGRIFKRYLEGPQIFCCLDCKTQLSTHDQIISKSFHGRGGKAYLFNSAINVTQGPLEKRMLITGEVSNSFAKCSGFSATDTVCCSHSFCTGMHTVADIYCVCCEGLLGWRYEEADEPSQKYKEGTFEH